MPDTKVILLAEVQTKGSKCRGPALSFFRIPSCHPAASYILFTPESHSSHTDSPAVIETALLCFSVSISEVFSGHPIQTAQLLLSYSALFSVLVWALCGIMFMDGQVIFIYSTVADFSTTVC